MKHLADAKGVRAKARRPRESSDSDAERRRSALLELIGKAPAGMTHPELRKLTPKMSTRDRSNALHTMKLAGAIQRKGNAWLLAS